MSIDNDSHISIELPDGSSFRSFIDFQVYNSNDFGGKIVRLEYQSFVQMAVMLVAHQKRSTQTLTDLPHSPARTQMRSIE
jgi:hypothetical protein